MPGRQGAVFFFAPWRPGAKQIACVPVFLQYFQTIKNAL